MDQNNKRVKTERVDMRIPVELLALVEEYQKENMMSSRTSAFLELVRKGLNAK